MPLMTMTSDLSWYGNPGWTPNPNTQTTDFQYNADLTTTAIPRGFDQAGHQVSFIPRTTQDAYPIDTALGPNGSAKRKAQRGNGSLFPIGPNGQVHVFDTKRTGWYIEDRYGDTFSNKTLTGLAATYTANSPIDDMYNKFKVRDEAYNPYGNMPFILRGIQRDGSSAPQRWGDINTNFEIKSLADIAKLRFLTDTKTVAGAVSALDVPRAGIAAFTDRTIHDTIRVGKFLLHPRGNAFIAKQQLLRLMSPNIEGVSGSVYKLSPQKLYNPVNTLLTVAGVGIGLHARNYGMLPTGGLSRYEDIHKAREIAQLGSVANRLVRLNDQRTGNRVSQVIPTWNVLTGYTGPDSFGGIGITDFKRISDYDTYRTNDIQPAAILDSLTAEYDRFNPYVKSREGFAAPGAFSDPQNSVDSRNLQSILSTYRKNSLFTLGTRFYISSAIPKDKTRFPIGNSIDRQLNFHNDTINNYGDALKIRFRTTSYSEPYVGDRTDSSATITNNTKPLTEDGAESKLKGSLKAKVDSNTFTGIPTKAPNPAKSEDNTPAIAKYKTLAYGRIPVRQSSTNTLDFRTGTDYNVSAVPMSKHVDTSKDKRLDVSDNVDHSLITLTIGGQSFIAYLQSFNESNNASISDLKALGIYQTYMYDSYERSIGLTFTVAARSKEELAKNWQKLKALQNLTLPSINSEKFWRPKTISLTIGDIYSGRQIILTSVNIDVDTETPWEITTGQQVPYYVTVDIQATIPSIDGATFSGFSVDTRAIANSIKDSPQKVQRTVSELNLIDGNDQQVDKDSNISNEPTDTVAPITDMA
jgi:hypothetical protein